MRDDDDFSDIPEASSLGGIFSGDGLSDIQNVPTKLAPDGYLVETRCTRCGRPKKITVSYQELTFIAAGRVPPDWFYENGMMRWGRGCNCSDAVKPYPFGLTPDECARAIGKAVTYQYLSPAQVQQLRQMVAQTPAAR